MMCKDCNLELVTVYGDGVWSQTHLMCPVCHGTYSMVCPKCKTYQVTETSNWATTKDLVTSVWVCDICKFQWREEIDLSL